MAMSPPSPHTCSSTRVTRADGETYTTPAAVLAEEACLIAPFQPGMNSDVGFMGTAENNRFVLFIEFDADVQLGDEITNDATSEVYVVVKGPVKFQNPTDWSDDHQQIEMEKRVIN